MIESNPQRAGGVGDELRPYIDEPEVQAINHVGERLASERPIPRAAFRSALRASLSEDTSARPAWRPRHLRVLVATYTGCGLLLLGVAAIGLAGGGPLAA